MTRRTAKTFVRGELRELCRRIHARNASVRFGDPKYSCIVGSDELLTLVTAIPELLDELDAVPSRRIRKRSKP